jgi:hypothetical protein
MKYPISVRQMDFSRLIEKTPEQKAEAERIAKQNRLKENASRILQQQREAVEREAAERAEAARQRKVQRVNLVIEQTVDLISLASEAAEVKRRVAGKFTQDQIIAMDDFAISDMYGNELAALRAERDR